MEVNCYYSMILKFDTNILSDPVHFDKFTWWVNIENNVKQNQVLIKRLCQLDGFYPMRYTHLQIFGWLFLRHLAHITSATMWTLGYWHPTRSCPTDWPHPDWRHWQSPESCLHNSCPTRRSTTVEPLSSQATVQCTLNISGVWRF